MSQRQRAIGIIDDPRLQQQIAASLPEYEFHWGLSLKGAIHRAAELRPAFILIDMDSQGDWADVAIALQSSPATRRIPLLGIAKTVSEIGAKEATRLSLHGPLLLDELTVQLPEWVAQRARVWDDDYYISLQTACERELPELAQQGIALFNRHEFWEAHEVLEHAWMEVRPAPIGELYRSILQIGVAYYQIQQQNYRGAIKMFLRAIQWLDPLPDICQGVDVAQFKRDAAAVRQTLEALGEARIGEFDPALFKPVPMVKEG
jgi:hypothetical protein